MILATRLAACSGGCWRLGRFFYSVLAVLCLLLDVVRCGGDEVRPTVKGENGSYLM